jgi:hypothetical protein
LTTEPQFLPEHAVALSGVQHPDPALHVICWPQLFVTLAPQIWPVHAAVLSGVQQPDPAVQVID